MDEAILERHLKKTTITSNVVSLVIAMFVALGVGYGFYYRTITTLDEHSENIESVKRDVLDIKTNLQDNAVFQGVSNSEMESLQKQVNGVETKVDRLDEKLDKIIFQTR